MGNIAITKHSQCLGTWKKHWLRSIHIILSKHGQKLKSATSVSYTTSVLNKKVKSFMTKVLMVFKRIYIIPSHICSFWMLQVIKCHLFSYMKWTLHSIGFRSLKLSTVEKNSLNIRLWFYWYWDSMFRRILVNCRAFMIRWLKYYNIREIETEPI